MLLDDFDYELPQALIAQFPPEERGASRLLHLDGKSGALVARQFRDIVELVAPGDVVVVNDTRVMNARLLGRKKTGGRIEVMVERVLGRDEVLAQVGANHPTRVGAKLVLADAVEATVVDREREFFRLRFENCEDVLALLQRHGSVPLPLYITRAAGSGDAERYQTVYARARGSVAAPTAGLHFTPELLTAIEQRGATLERIVLHVGVGTFRPVEVDDPASHAMHAEWYDVPADVAERLNAARGAGGAL